MSTPLEQWVDEVAGHTRPKDISWVDGSEAENDRLIREMLASGTLSQLNQSKYPNCYLHRSDPSDVARTEHLTFICSREKDDAGPTNNWMAPREAKEKVGGLFRGAMQGRTMYVIPYLMGPVGSPFSKVGVEITDSPYVVASMRIMTRMGTPAMKAFGERYRSRYNQEPILYVATFRPSDHVAALWAYRDTGGAPVGPVVTPTPVISGARTSPSGGPGSGLISALRSSQAPYVGLGLAALIVIGLAVVANFRGSRR